MTEFLTITKWDDKEKTIMIEVKRDKFNFILLNKAEQLDLLNYLNLLLRE